MPPSADICHPVSSCIFTYVPPFLRLFLPAQVSSLPSTFLPFSPSLPLSASILPAIPPCPLLSARYPLSSSTLVFLPPSLPPSLRPSIPFCLLPPSFSRRPRVVHKEEVRPVGRCKAPPPRHLRRLQRLIERKSLAMQRCHSARSQHRTSPDRHKHPSAAAAACALTSALEQTR